MTCVAEAAVGAANQPAANPFLRARDLWVSDCLGGAAKGAA